MANNFTIVIDAVDRSSSAFKSAGNSLLNLERRMAKANATMPQMGEVESFLKRSTLVTGGIVAGIAGAVAMITSKMMSIESVWANTVRNVSNTSLSLGVDPRQMFGIQNSAKMVGIEPEQTTAGVESVSRGYYEAEQGRDPQKRMIYQAWGIDGRDSAGNFSPEKLLEQIARAGERVNEKNGPFARHHLFDQLGASGLENLLNQGADKVRASYQQGLSNAPTDSDIQHAKDYAAEMSKLDIQLDKLKSTINGGLAPALTSLLNQINQFVDRANGGKAAPKPNIGDRLADGVEMLGNALRGNGAVTNEGASAGKVGATIAYYEAHGLGRNAAIGFAANFMRESSFDDRKVGDHGSAVGLGQWHPDRQALFKKVFGVDIQHSKPEQQLAFPLWEMKYGPEKATAAALRSASSPEDAAEIVSRLYERPMDANGEAKVRADMARQIDGLYSKSPPSDAQANRATVSSSGTPASDSKSVDNTQTAASGQLTVKVELGNLPKGSRTSVSSSPNVSSTVQSGSTGRTDQFALGATY